MTPPVFVVDTNVLAAGLITSDVQSPVARIVDTMLAGTLIYLLSPALLDEYRSVLLRPKLISAHGLTIQEVDILLTELVSNALWHDPESPVSAPDHGDDHLWALLAAQPGSTLITGDRLLLDNPPERTSVILPRTYVDRFLYG